MTGPEICKNLGVGTRRTKVEHYQLTELDSSGSISVLTWRGLRNGGTRLSNVVL